MITKTGLHAVRAIVALAKLAPDGYAGAARVAQKIGAPQNYLGKLLQTLAQEGIVRSQKGLGGGFRLARDPRHIPIEHISRWAGCILGRPECSEDDPCAVHNRLNVVRNACLNLLQKTTIAKLVEHGGLKAARAGPGAGTYPEAAKARHTATHF